MRRPPTNEEARGACDALAALAPHIRNALANGTAYGSDMDRLICALGVDLDAQHVPPHVEAAMTWATGR